METPQDKISQRWTPLLAKRFCPVSSRFLSEYHRLSPKNGERKLNSTEVLLIIHLMDYKWDERPPFPAIETIAERMDLSDRMVRKALAHLERCGYVIREYVPGRSTRYRFDGLFAALEALSMEETQSTKEAA